VTGNQECELESLLLIEARVTVSRVIQAEILFDEALATAHAFGDGITRKLQVHATEEGTVLLVDLERGGDLGEDAAEVAGFDAGWS